MKSAQMGYNADTATFESLQEGVYLSTSGYARLLRMW